MEWGVIAPIVVSHGYPSLRWPDIHLTLRACLPHAAPATRAGTLRAALKDHVVVMPTSSSGFRPLLADQDFGCLHAGNRPPVSSKRPRQAARAS
jgi:hypothetical protein